MSISPKKAKTGESPIETELGGGSGVSSGGQSGGGSLVVSQRSSIEPLYFFGRYEHATDVKRRMQIPSKWRPEQTENYELTLMGWTSGDQANSCLLVLSPSELDRFIKSLASMSWGDEEAEVLKRSLGGDSETVKYDQVGRICISDRMAEIAGIEKKTGAMLVGLITAFQIWNVDRYKNRRTKDGVTLPQVLRKLDEQQKKSA